MKPDADFTVDRSGREPVIALTGDWTTLAIGHAADRLRLEARPGETFAIDVASLGRVDTAGVLVLARVGHGVLPALVAARPELRSLSDIVVAAIAPASMRKRADSRRLVERFGRAVVAAAEEGFDALVFLGRLGATIFALCRAPTRLRLAPTIRVMEHAGLGAVPIVVATSFFVGATVAFLGATLLAQFGAQVFTVELVGIGVLRECGVLVTCVILAGRSGSSFAAEIAAMRMSQELDAMQTLGVDPFEALVLPRLLAMLLMTPLLAAAATIAGVAGGLLVVWSRLDLSPAFFFDRLIDNVGVEPFALGIIKAPVLAAMIAIIACRQGWRARGGVEELGRRVTAAVVQALFAIIIGDAVFAVAFAGLGL